MLVTNCSWIDFMRKPLDTRWWPIECTHSIWECNWPVPVKFCCGKPLFASWLYWSSFDLWNPHHLLIAALLLLLLPGLLQVPIRLVFSSFPFFWLLWPSFYGCNCLWPWFGLLSNVQVFLPSIISFLLNFMAWRQAQSWASLDRVLATLYRTVPFQPISQMTYFPTFSRDSSWSL